MRFSATLPYCSATSAYVAGLPPVVVTLARAANTARGLPAARIMWSILQLSMPWCCGLITEQMAEHLLAAASAQHCPALVAVFISSILCGVQEIEYLREDEVDIDEGEDDDLEDFGADYSDDGDNDSGEGGTSGGCPSTGTRSWLHSALAHYTQRLGGSATRQHVYAHARSEMLEVRRQKRRQKGRCMAPRVQMHPHVPPSAQDYTHAFSRLRYVCR